jgi:hypothetical protein
MDRAGKLTKSGLALLILGISSWAGACHKNPVRPLPAPPPVVRPATTAPQPLPVPATWSDLPLPPSRLPPPPEPPLPKNFRDGEASFHGGKYSEAARFYEKYLREAMVDHYKDEAMFKLGLCYALECSSSVCRERSLSQFKDLIKAFPKSQFSTEAGVILGLHGEIDRMKSDVKTRDERITKLADELERLKKIDLERRPTPIKK